MYQNHEKTVHSLEYFPIISVFENLTNISRILLLKIDVRVYDNEKSSALNERQCNLWLTSENPGYLTTANGSPMKSLIRHTCGIHYVWSEGRPIKTKPKTNKSFWKRTSSEYYSDFPKHKKKKTSTYLGASERTKEHGHVWLTLVFKSLNVLCNSPIFLLSCSNLAVEHIMLC